MVDCFLPTSAPSLPGDPILIVEDDADIREALEQILRDEGYDVRCAADGREALDALEKGPLPIVILLDLMMPIMTGWQFLDEQRQRPHLADVPVVVISADPWLEAKADTLRGAKVLKKPVHLDQLLSLIRSLKQP